MLVGKDIGPFHIESELGSGAMGSVFKARYAETGKYVAFKVIALGLAGNETALARFDREAAILKQLKHPNIVRLFATGRYKGTPFLAMEFIEGDTLERILEHRSKFSWEEVILIGQQICAALQHAHEQGIVHRDLKPANLMVTLDEVVKLTDFGIAKDVDVTALTGANSTIGTAAYMSPEQCRGERTLTGKSDLYSLGIVLYELLTGRKPFQAETAIEMFMLHTKGKFERPSRIILDVPVWLDTIIVQLLEKKPEHRPINAEMVAKALSEVADKVAAQRSAGLERANTRRLDSPHGVGPIDEADREAAQMLRGKKKGKKAKANQTLTAQRWVSIAAVGILALGLGAAIFWALQPPSAAGLFEQAKAAMTARDEEKAEAAIQKFLQHHGTATDAQAEQIRAWDQQLKVDLKERNVSVWRKGKFPPADDGGPIALKALDAEDRGDLKAAVGYWNDLRTKYADSTKPDEKVYVWYVERRLAQHAKAKQLLAQLTAELGSDRRERKYRERTTTTERLAVEALRFELFGDRTTARDKWKQLAQDCVKESDQRLWLLLAAERSAELQAGLPERKPDVEKAERHQLLKAKLAEITANKENPTKRGPHRFDCDDIIALYRDHPDPEIKPLVKQAEQLLQELQQVR